MTQAIAVNYETAQAFVQSGVWRVDPAAGQVFGKRGLPFQRTNSWGYVQIKFRHPDNWRREVAVLAHRVVWESVHGPTPPGQEINHRNGVKTDNRLANLEPVSHAENMQHAVATGLAKPLTGSACPHALLDDDQVLAIYRRAWTGENQRLIGDDYGVTRSIVSNIKRGWAWAHITGHARTHSE